MSGSLAKDEELSRNACLPAFEPKLVLSFDLGSGRCHFVMDTEILGRSWGGFRIAEGLSLEEVKILARTMTIKTALAGIPIGGAKAGLSPSKTPGNRTELLREICSAIGPYIRRRNYFLGTDLGFTESDANFLYECAGTKRKLPSALLSVGEACAEGVAVSLKFIEQREICKLERRTVALEGFGRIGIPTAKMLGSQGFRIVAISNLAGVLYDPGGLDVDELSSIQGRSPEDMLGAYKAAHRDVELLERERLHYVDSEVLIPGARALSIDREVAENIKAKAVCPISNAPLTLAAEETLVKRGVVSVPDIISNTGGLIASFSQHLGANRPQTEAIISEVITQNLESVFSSLPSNQVPKLMAGQIGLRRLKEIQKSETVGVIKCLAPWLKRLGSSAIINGLKEYLTMKLGS